MIQRKNAEPSHSPVLRTFVYGMIGPGFEPHQCLLTGTRKRTAQLPCWPSWGQQVLHQRCISGSMSVTGPDGPTFKTQWHPWEMCFTCEIRFCLVWVVNAVILLPFRFDVVFVFDFIRCEHIPVSKRCAVVWQTEHKQVLPHLWHYLWLPVFTCNITCNHLSDLYHLFVCLFVARRSRNHLSHLYYLFVCLFVARRSRDIYLVIYLVIWYLLSHTFFTPQSRSTIRKVFCCHHFRVCMRMG